jgi:hypothetical protein
MPITSRRALLGALAVVPALTAPAVAAVANPDAALLALGDKLQAAEVAQKAALVADRRTDSLMTAEALERADSALYGIEMKILECRAETPAGRALKARIALAKIIDEGEEGTYGEAWARSALADVIAAG